MQVTGDDPYLCKSSFASETWVYGVRTNNLIEDNAISEAIVPATKVKNDKTGDEVGVWNMI